jgi:hypothetical protein
MAKTITVDLELKYKEAVKDLDEFQKEYEKLQNTVQKENKETSTSIKNIEKSSGSAAAGIKKIGTAIKAIGIGLLLAAFAKLKEVFEENQKVADFFNTTFEALSLAFNDFFNFVDKNAGTIIGYFKAIFNDPVQSLKDLGQAIKENIIERFNSALEVAGHLGSALVKLFKGDFSGALDSVKEAGKELVDVATGVDDSFNKISDVVSDAAGAISDYAKNTWNAAKNTVELNKAAAMSEVLLQGLIEKYDRQAEQLRQVRDEERNTIADRIKANEDLKAVLDEQEEAMRQQAQNIINAAQAQYNKNKNDANALELQRAKNEAAAIEAQIEGFRSEQKQNAMALDREAIELNQSLIDGRTERAIKENEFIAEQIEGEYLRLEAQKAIAQEEARLEEERLTNKRNQYKEGAQAYVDANNELLNFQQDNNQKQLDLDKKLNIAKQQLVTDALGNLATIVGENSKFGKGIAVVQGIRDTLAGANKALSASPPPFNFIAAAAVTAAGIANVKSILSSKEPQAPSFARGASSAGSVTAPSIPTPPSFNVVGTSGTSQLADVIAGQTDKPMRAYVVASDISTAQSLERNIVKGASL